MKTFLSVLVLVLTTSAWAVPTTLSVVQVSETAAAVASNAADTSNGNRVLNPGCDVFFVLQNTDGSNSATVTFTAQKTSIAVPGFGSLTAADKAVALTAGQIKHVGPFNCGVWNDSSGYIQMATTGTGASSVKINPLKVIRP